MRKKSTPESAAITEAKTPKFTQLSPIEEWKAKLKAKLELEEAHAAKVEAARQAFQLKISADQQALNAAREEALELKQELVAARREAIIAVLTPDLIDALAPEHASFRGRPECSDEKPIQYSPEEAGCPRCTLKAAAEVKWGNFNWTFTVEPL